MKQMKKVLMILLTVILLFGLCACGGAGSTSGGSAAPEDRAESAAADTNVFLTGFDGQVLAMTFTTPSELQLKKVDDRALFRFDSRHSYAGLLMNEDITIAPGCTYLYPQANIDEYIAFVSESYEVQPITVDGQKGSFHHDKRGTMFWITIDGSQKGMGEKGIIQMEIARSGDDPNLSVFDVTDEETLKSIVEGMTFELLSPEEAAEKYPEEPVIRE